MGRPWVTRHGPAMGLPWGPRDFQVVTHGSLMGL